MATRSAPPTTGTAAAPPSTARHWELDVARSVAIAMMVVYHTAYDVRLLAPDLGVNPFDGGWRVLQVVCGSTFLALVGVSFSVADQRARRRGATGLALWRAHAPRGLQVLGAALLITLATLVAMGPDDAVRFGILHLIAVAMLVVLPAMARLGRLNLLLGLIAIPVGLVLNSTGTDVDSALLLGLDPGETGVDWYPLLPWIGMPLIGIAIGCVLYPGGERRQDLSALATPPSWAARAGAPGRRSLPIYLVHQPVLIALTGAVLILAGTELDGP